MKGRRDEGREGRVERLVEMTNCQIFFHFIDFFCCSVCCIYLSAAH